MPIDTFSSLIKQARFNDGYGAPPVLTITQVLEKEGDWRKIIAVLEPYWEDLLLENIQKVSLTRDVWNNHIFTLFRAQVEADQFGKAEQLIKTWIAEGGVTGPVIHHVGGRPVTLPGMPTTGPENDAREYVLKRLGRLPSEKWPE
jgi:hypothetical protein